jgi:type VII secretion integral membrane protein EccD
VTASVVSNTCRLTVISATLRVDLAVPEQISIAELLSIVVSGLGPETADRGAAEGGWVLQRAGETPLDPSLTVAASQLRDGDTLHLRTRATRLPELAFDDVLEAVASGVLTRTARWQPLHTMRATAVFSGAMLVFAAITLVLSGPDWLAPAVTAGAGSVLSVLAATALERLYHRTAPALAAGGLAVVLAAACGATAVGAGHRIADFGAPQVLVGVSAAAFVSVVLLIALARGIAGFGTVITVCLLTMIGTGIAVGTSLAAPATASVVATAGLAISPLLPSLSFRLARLPLPAIPLDAADLRRETGSIDAREILGRAVRADDYLTGLSGGVALAIAGAAVLLSGAGTSERVLAIVLGLICLLRARLFTGVAQRTLLLTAGGAALLAVLVSATYQAHGLTRILAFVVPTMAVGLVLFSLAVTLPGRRYSPPLSRTADIFEGLLVLSVIPLALGVMGVYGAVRQASS